MPDGYFLSPEEYALFCRMGAEFTRLPRSKPTRDQLGGVEDQEMFAPEVYVAFTPDGGIPALNHNTSPTGTGTTALSDDAPGCATGCRIFQVIGDCETSDDTLYPVGSDGQPDTVTVYNLSDTAVPGDTWVLVLRDKFGYWWAVTGGSGGLTVCGNPHAQKHTTLTDPGTACPTADDTEVATPSITALKFDPKVIQVIISTSGSCGGPGTGTGTGFSTTAMGKTADIEISGMDVTVEVPYGSITICTATCSVIQQKQYLCFRHGVLMGMYLGPAVSC